MPRLLLPFACLAAVLLTALVGFIELTVYYLDTSPQYYYGVVLDAGSVHTTATVYAWPAAKRNGTGEVAEVFSCEGDADSGVSACHEAPQRVGRALTAGGCLERARKAVPDGQRPRTTLFMGATAGMRVLNATDHSAADSIMRQANRFLSKEGFNHSASRPFAKILGSGEEGVFGWMTANYLHGSFNASHSQPSVGALDWGGASTQITFQVDSSSPVGARNVSLFGRDYHVFTASHLCYGQKEALRRYFTELVYQQFLSSGALPTTVDSPCQPAPSSGGDEPYSLPASEIFSSVCTRRSDARFQRLAESRPDRVFTFVGTSDLRRCRREVAKAFDHQRCLAAYASPHCFHAADVPRPPSRGNATFLAFSTYWYLVSALRIPPGRIAEADFASSVARLCRSSMGYARSLLGSLGREVEHCTCFKGVFMERLLRDGYHFPHWTDIDFVRRVAGAEVGWTLGYMLQASNDL